MRKLLTGLGIFSVAFTKSWAVSPTVELISVSSEGIQADAASYVSAISADGRYVAFSSAATNLVVGDGNKAVDIFVRDRNQGTTERVSIGTNGLEANAASGIDVYALGGGYPASLTILPSGQATITTTDIPSYGYGQLDSLDISADGRYVVFSSRADNLIAGDTNQAQDIFVYDRQSRRTERVSVSTNGTEGNARSFKPSLSTDGRYVAFLSEANNLVADDANGKVDVFVRDRQTGITTRINVDSHGLESNGDAKSAHLSANGRFVVFSSAAEYLIPPGKSDYLGQTNLFVRDLINGVTDLVSNQRVGSVRDMDMPGISSDGRYVAFLGYPVRSMNYHCFTPSVNPYFQDRTGAIAIALQEDGYLGIGEPDLYLTGSCTTYFGQPPYYSIDPQMSVQLNDPYRAILISEDQRYLVFNSGGRVERYDRLSGLTEVASYDAQNPPYDWPSGDTLGDVSANGRIVSLTTTSEVRVENDNNGVADILVSDSGPAPVIVPQAGTDLGIEFYPDTYLSVSANHVFGYTLHVVNKGPNAVADMKLTANIPFDFKVLSSATDLGSCKPGNRVECNLGKLPTGAEARVHVQVRAGRYLSKTAIQANGNFYVRDSKGKIPVLANGKPNTKFLRRIKSKVPLAVKVTR